MNDTFIPFHVPSIGDAEIAEVTAVLRSGWLTTGPRTRQFEEDFQHYSGARFALAVNSCTAALHLALVALNIGPGDEVITSPLTFCATVNTILQTGATPVLADVDRHGNLDPRSVAARLSHRTRAIVPVHLGGRVCALDTLWQLAGRHHLAVVEDAAHAAGSRHHGVPLGRDGSSLSQAVAYSFYATKNITTGEGGMLTTNDEALAARMRLLALHGISKDAWMRYAENGNWFYQVQEVGFKYNMSDIAAAIGIHQLRRIAEFAAIRRDIAGAYCTALHSVEEVELPSLDDADANSWHLFLLRLRPESLTISRAQFIAALHTLGIGASVHFIPIPLHPCYSSWAGSPRNHCPQALAFYQGVVSLPLYPALTPHCIRRIIDAVKDVVARNSKTALLTLS